MRTGIRLISGFIATAIGLCSIAATAAFGLFFSAGPERYLYAAIFGCLDAAKMVLPTLASIASENGNQERAAIARAAYLALAVMSISTHVGLYAVIKNDVLGTADAGRLRYEAAISEKKALQADIAAIGSPRAIGTIESELATKRLDVRFTRSKSCLDVTVADSRALCSEIAALQGEKDNAGRLETLKAKLEAAEDRLRNIDVVAAVKSADPQAQQLADLTGLTENRIRLLMALALSLFIEMGSSLLLDIVAASRRAKDLPDVGHAAEDVQSAETGAEASEDDHSAVADWASENLHKKRGGYARCTEYREAHARHVRAAGGEPPSPNSFGRSMSALGYKRKKRGGHFYFTGVDLAQPGLKVVRAS
jgi:hypothetical protein